MMSWRTAPSLTLLLACIGLLCASCGTKPGAFATQRKGDEIMVCGRLVHTGAPVVLWTDPGGYDAYRIERRFVADQDAGWAATLASGKAPDSPNRFDLRRAGLTPEEIERVRGGGWDLPTLQRVVDQFVLHYDVSGVSRQCFRVLHDMRGLSVHFMLDIDGTIYQTLDVKERAWHATVSNHRSIGIEIANIGAYTAGDNAQFARWYAQDKFPGPAGTTGSKVKTRITIPSALGDGGIRTPNFVAYCDRPGMIFGDINGTRYAQYDLTPQQYESLAKLTASLCSVLPQIRCDYPRDASGTLLTRTLTPDELANFKGVLGHYHVQKNKIDPGPAFQWDRVINEARTMSGMSRLQDGAERKDAE